MDNDVTLDDFLALTNKLDNRLLYLKALIDDDRKEEALKVLGEIIGI